MELFNLVASLSLDSSKYEAGLDNAKKQGGGIGSAVKGGMKIATAALAAGAAAAGAFAASAVKVGMSFDSSMSQVAATMGVTVDQIQELRDFAQEMGASTAFSASQAADALNYMALAGYDAETSMSMLPTVLNLAAAGGIELAYASDMITDSQSALGLTIEETTELVDIMAQTSSKTNTSVAQLGEAILTIGGTAKNMAGGTVELAQVLGLLADNGIKGSEAGTKLRNIMLSLSAPTDKAAGMLEELGVNAFDANGNMRDMQSIFGDLNTVMGKMTQAEQEYAKSVIFNKADLAAVNALLATQADRWEEVEGYLTEATGAAEKMADTQLDNLTGDITLMKSALEGLQIAVSDKLSPTIRGFVQTASDSFSRLTKAVSEGGIMGAFEELGSIGSEILNNIVQGFAEGVPKFFELVPSIASKIFEGITASTPMLFSAGISMLQSITQGIAQNLGELIPAAMEAIMGFSGSLRENVGQLVDAGLELIMTLAQSLIDNIPVFIETIPTIVSNIAGIINDNAPKLLASGIELIGKLVVGIIKSIPTLIAEFPKIIKAIADVITAFNWVSLGKHIITFIKNGVQNLFHELPNTLKNIGHKAVEFFKGIDWKDLGTSLITKIVNGIKGLLTNVPKALKEVGTKAWEAFKEIDWLELGSNVISGIVSGIMGGLGKVASAAKEAASNAFNAAKEFLGIESPSKEFMWIGKMVDEGFAGGIDKYSDTVDRSIGKLADATFDPFMNMPEMSGGEMSGGTSININVYGAENQSPTEIAEEVERILNRKIRSRAAVFA